MAELGPPRAEPLGIGLIALTLAWAGIAYLGSDSFLVLPLLLPVAGSGLGFWLTRRAQAGGRLAGIVPAITFMVPVVLLPSGLESLGLGLGAALLALLWIGYPSVRAAGLPMADVGRELVLPLAGGIVALVVSAIPVLDVLRPAALVIPVFAGLALLVILLAELSTPPAEPAGRSPSTASGDSI
ncbi:MAG TPA: hypothetical protein VEY07_03130 [Thermoplasmata archaeon]|nr:hypothetical protein [Thermoplasmata archaeon]